MKTPKAKQNLVEQLYNKYLAIRKRRDKADDEAVLAFSVYSQARAGKVTC